VNYKLAALRINIMIFFLFLCGFFHRNQGALVGHNGKGWRRIKIGRETLNHPRLSEWIVSALFLVLNSAENPDGAGAGGVLVVDPLTLGVVGDTGGLEIGAVEAETGAAVDTVVFVFADDDSDDDADEDDDEDDNRLSTPVCDMDTVVVVVVND
jgi:hypothetical protein